MKISIICTEENHPINKELKKWIEKEKKHHDITLVRNSDQLTNGDILFLISCHEIISKNTREKFQYTLVLHASDLPEGKGMSPHIWQILEGKNTIILSLLNADDKLDAGDIWLKIPIVLQGHELFDEINEKIFAAEIDAMSWALKNIKNSIPTSQNGIATFYRKRTPEDSRIDPNKTIKEQFNLLRVADRNRYPSFFDMDDYRYIITIEKIKK